MIQKKVPYRSYISEGPSMKEMPPTNWVTKESLLKSPFIKVWAGLEEPKNKGAVLAGLLPPLEGALREPVWGRCLWQGQPSRKEAWEVNTQNSLFSCPQSPAKDPH